jgi:thioredoxin reductase
MDFMIISEDYGGQLNVAGEIENYPGYKSTNQFEFSEKLKEQLEYNNIEITYESVKKIERGIDGHFVVKTDEDEHEAETIIYATGARARHLNVPGEDIYANRGVTYCAICDGPLFKDKVVAVVGGGDAALEAIDFLLRIAKKIYVLTINPKLIGHEYLVERVEGNERVEIIPNSKTVEILGDGKKVTGLKYDQNGQIKQLDLEGVFVEIGRVPNTEPLKGFVDIEKDGHIIIDKYAQTSVPGIFAAGDCTDLHGYQFAISGGEGVKALLNAAKYLQSKEGAPAPK